MNRKLDKNSEAVQMNVMAKTSEDVENSWGENNQEQVRVSWWRKENHGFKRNIEGRKEIHKDIYIFDLCNKWVKFGGENSEARADNEVERNQENQDTISGGYGYIWSDVCHIVKEKGNDVSWEEFVTTVMNTQNLVTISDCCRAERKDICQGDRSWNNGKWIKECFNKEKELQKDISKKKICNSFWEDSQTQQLLKVEESNNNCLEEDIIKRISQRIKISRNKFGDDGQNGSNKYWCKEHNGYYEKNGNEKKIKDECKTTLKNKIKEFVNKNKGNRNSQQLGNNEKCQSLYDGKRFEVKCNDGWKLATAKKD